MQNTSGKLIPGLKIASKKKNHLKELISQLDSKPVLRIIQVGDDSASTLYVNLKIQAASDIGIDAESMVFPTGENHDVIKTKIAEFNNDENVHGIIIQAPIQGVSEAESLDVFDSIDPKKDVDGLTQDSLGKLWQIRSIEKLADIDTFISATPLAVMDCLLWLQKGEVSLEDRYQDRFNSLRQFLQGKNVLIVNHSIIVGKPLAALCLAAGATVTIAHEFTQDVNSMIEKADIIMPATGVDGLFKLDQFREDQIVIDIGINNSSPGEKVKGDVELSKDYSDEFAKIPHLAAVPGGVGPLTVINLLYNTYLSYIRK